MLFRWRKALTLFVCLIPATLAGAKVAAEVAYRCDQRAENRRCGTVTHQVRQVQDAAMYYAAEHDHFPDADRFESELRPYLAPGFRFSLPSPRGTRPQRIAMNSRFSRRPMNADLTGVVFFESVAPTPNAHDELYSVPAAEDGSVDSYFGYADGHGYSYPVATVVDGLKAGRGKGTEWLLGRAK